MQALVSAGVVALGEMHAVFALVFAALGTATLFSVVQLS
jgi:hypothetical protein